MIHRVGPVPITEAAVIVAASSPHRSAAFEAARYGIDTLKSTVPVWKKERWERGSSWGLEAQHIVSEAQHIVSEAQHTVSADDDGAAGEAPE
jgi:molybdopterin synthase catalytic subunit